MAAERDDKRSPKDTVELALLVTKITVLVLSYLKRRKWGKKRKRKTANKGENCTAITER